MYSLKGFDLRNVCLGDSVDQSLSSYTYVSEAIAFSETSMCYRGKRKFKLQNTLTYTRSRNFPRQAISPPLSPDVLDSLVMLVVLALVTLPLQ